MKRPLSILLVALIFVGFNSCKKAKEEVDEITEFDINYQTSITVPSNTLGINAPADYTTADVQTKSTENFTNNKTAANLVDKIVMTKFNVSVGTGNLDFLKSLSVYIKAQGLNETLAALQKIVGRLHIKTL